MKKMTFLAAMLAGMAATAPGFAQQYEQEPFAVYKFPAGKIEKVTVSTIGGSIRINGNATDSAVVEVRIRPLKRKLSKEEIQKILNDEFAMDTKVVEGELQAIVSRKTRLTKAERQLTISFYVSVPQKVSTASKTSGGSIHIQRLNGRHDLNTSGGSLHIENVGGHVTGHTSGGSIHISGGTGTTELVTSGGSIHAEQLQGGNYTFKTSGGSVNLNNISGNVIAATSGGSIRLIDLTGSIDAKTSGGSVHAARVSGTLHTGTSGGNMRLQNIAGNLDAKTSGGSMNVQMTSVYKYVRLTNSGNISLSLPEGKGYTLKIHSSDKINTSSLDNFSGIFESKNIDGTLNGGGAEITVKSSQRVNLTFE
ncbi:MAG: DUF4097 domain-containing protein [Prevotellaceae bacterium]|jgi:hypothetical protein|nr:DUF4097 domain-containing protein [Prevotellaceae bacterium]